MSYYKGGSVSDTHASINSDLEGDLRSAPTKSEILILLVSTRDLSVLFRYEFSCIVQLILHDCKVSASRCCLFRSSLLRIVKVIK
jgi:hypothetical protein